MTEIEELRAEVAKLREEVAQLRAERSVHHYHLQVAQPVYWQPGPGAPYPIVARMDGIGACITYGPDN